MKLTNYHRDAFIERVMDDVPHINYDDQVQDGILKAFVDALPPAAQRLWEDPDALRAKLRSVVHGCTTRKQLAEALPEFEKYLPPESAKGSNLPAVANVVTEFVQAGWPVSKAAA